MRALIMARSRNPVPIEQAAMLAQAFKDWREQHRNRLEYFAWFTSGNGGCAIASVADETELFQMMVSWPLNQYSDVDTYTLVDGDAALTFWADMLQNIASGQQG